MQNMNTYGFGWVTGAAVLVTAVLWQFFINNLMWAAVDAGFFVLALFGFGAFVLSGFKNPLSGIGGLDGRGSTSKFQAFLWFLAVFFSATALVAAKIWLDATPHLVSLAQIDQTFPNLPPNLLIALGFSATTLAAAKGITTVYTADGKVIKSQLPTTPTTPAAGGTPTTSAAGSTPSAPPSNDTAGAVSGIFLEDDGTFSLSKVQLLGWTFLSIIIFLLAVFQNLTKLSSHLACYSDKPGSMTALCQSLGFTLDPLTDKLPNLLGLPDIDPTLMVLMGLGAGTYLGFKLVQTNQARLTGIWPSGGLPGTTITLYGSGLSTGAQGGQILIDDQPSAQTSGKWADDQVSFILPDKKPNGTAIVPPQQIQIGLVAGGNKVMPAQAFSIMAAQIPTVSKLNPTTGPLGGGTRVTITGGDFSGLDTGDPCGVNFGGQLVPPEPGSTPGSILVVSPPAPGPTAVDVRAVTPLGISPPNQPGAQFIYLAAPAVTTLNPSNGSTAGGTRVTITGSGLSGATAVNFGQSVGTIQPGGTDTNLAVLSPANEAPGLVEVSVVGPGGASPANPRVTQFTYT